MDTLPELPRKLKKNESRITPIVMDWFQKNYPHDWAIEIKQTSGNSIPKSAVKPHQLKALIAVRSEKGFKHKLSDALRQRQPFDAFGYKKSHSFVVACFLNKGICLAIKPEEWNGANLNVSHTFSFHL